YSMSGTYNGSCGTTATCKLTQFCTKNSQCGSGGCDTTLDACKCTSNTQCSSGVCNLGYCVSTDASCARCQTLQTCATAADCMGGACTAVANRAAGACGCSSN